MKIKGNNITVPALFGEIEYGYPIVETIQDILNVDTNKATKVQILGYHTTNDGGAGIFVWDATEDKANHNGGTIIDPSKTFPSDWSDQTALQSWFAGDGLGAGCWKRVYDGAVNVKWFGAKGDGATDDTKAIQSAVDLDSEIIFDGNFITTDIINVNMSYLKFFSLSSLTSSSNNAIIYFKATSERTKSGIEGGRLFGNINGSMTGIVIDGRKNLYIQDTGIFNCGSHGVEFKDENGFIENIVINKLEIDTVGEHGLFINKFDNSNFINEITITALEIRQAGSVIGSGNEIFMYNAGVLGSAPKISAFTFIHCNFDIRSANDSNPRDVERLANGIDIIKFSSAGGLIEHINFYDCSFENTKLNDFTTQFAINFDSGANRIKILDPLMSSIGYKRNENNISSLYFETPDKQVYSTHPIYLKYVGNGSFLQMTDSDNNPTNSSLWDINIRRSDDYARIGISSTDTTKSAGIFFDTDDGDYSGNYSYILKNSSNGDLDIAQTTTGNINLLCYSELIFSCNNNGISTMITNLPTTDPLVAGQLWNDAGVVKVSAG